MTTQIVVGVDGSQPAERALIWAADAASRRGAQLVIVHAGDVPATAGEHSRDLSHELLRDAVATAIDVSGTCNISTVLREEQPARLLLELSDGASMLVVGTHGVGRVVGALLGSVASRVAAHARCPVVVVPEHWRAPTEDEPHAVAVGVSASVPGRDALEFAFTEAEARGAQLLAVRAWAELDWTTPTGDFMATGNDSVRHEQQELLTRLVEAAWARHRGVEVVTELSSETVYGALHNAASRADLLVMGCRHSDERHFSRLGPIASRLLHTSSCPVVVVGHPIAPMTGQAATTDEPALA